MNDNHSVKVVIGELEIVADGYIPIPEENAVKFYRNKSSVDYIQPIKVDVNVLSDFGKLVLTGLESEE